MRGNGVSFQKIHTGSLRVHIGYIFALYNMLIGKGKAAPRGHMTFTDMLDEYLRIAL